MSRQENTRRATLSEVMRRAWATFRARRSDTFANCLRFAWAFVRGLPLPTVAPVRVIHLRSMVRAAPVHAVGAGYRGNAWAASRFGR